MKIQQLDDDCLKAVLVRLPLKSVIRNVRPVSKRFRDAAEFSLKHLVALQPISLEVCSGCRHRPYVRDESPKITLAGMNVSTANLPELLNCALLPLVSKVSLCDPFCSKLSRDFKVQLTLSAILEKLSSAAHLTLLLHPNDHYGQLDVGPYYVYKTNSHGLQRPFSRIIAKATNMLAQLQTLQLQPTWTSACAVQLSLDNLNDFSQFLTFARHLRKLVVPIHVFEYATKADQTVLQQLNTLELFAGGVSNKITCQRVFEMIAAACSELTELRYNCALRGYDSDSCCSATKCCVTNIGVLQTLSKLRSLTLRFGDASTKPEIVKLPLLERLTLTLSRSVRKATQMMQLLKIGSNLKRLELLRLDDSQTRMAEMIIAQLKRFLIFGALPRLEAIRIDSSYPDCSDHYSSVCSQIHAITTIPTAFSLRKIEIIEPYETCVVSLLSENSPSCQQAGPGSTGLTFAIADAENIAELCFPLDWNDSYLQLEQLLLAMQHGSLKRLAVAVNWRRERPHFGIDRRVVSSILPAGCQIAEWNVSIEDHKSKLTSIVIAGRKLGSWSNQDEDCKFWVYLRAQRDPKILNR